jgi:hypothetical protein
MRLKCLAGKIKTLTTRKLKDGYDKNALSSSSMTRKMLSMGETLNLQHGSAI